ncbi:MAG: FecR domain-containing protein [Congregibacter sp.]
MKAWRLPSLRAWPSLLRSFCRVLVLLSLSLPTKVHANEWVYVVVPGDNLWSFSERYLDSVARFEALRKMNNIENPRRMQPGSRIRVPMAWIDSNAVPATIAAIEGSAVLTRSTGELVDLSLGERVLLGDSIRTFSDTSIAVRFADGSVLTLYSDSELRFDHLSAHGETGMVDSRMTLLRGRLDTRVNPAEGPGSRFEIHTPSAVSAVRGTEYRAATDLTASSIEVLDGSVAVNGDIGQELVTEGFGTRVEAGKAPIPPKALLPAPRLEVFPKPVQSLGWPVRWGREPHAEAYRLELSNTPSFNTIIWHELTNRDTAQLPDLADSKYHLRLRAIDSTGLEGKAAIASFELNARPQAPVALQPAEGQIVREKIPRLSWAASNDASAYQLQVARDANFGDLILDETGLSQTDYESAALGKPDRYYWRVTSIAADGELGPSGPARSFEIRPAHQQVDAKIEGGNTNQLVATWLPSAPGLAYQVQVAFDRNFNKLEFDRVVEQPMLALESRSTRTRYLRVRTVEPDGYSGPWGASQRIDTEKKAHSWLLIPIFVILALVAP